MGTYNVTKIESWLKDFTSAKDKFYNTYYSDFKNSYIKKCNDSAVVRMRNKLSQHYERINRINGRIKNIWEYYLHDLKVIDDKLAGAKGSANDSAIASKLAKLPTLKEYKSNLSIKINSASAVVGTVDKLGWSEDKDWGANLQTVLDRTEATITVAGTAVIEGIGKFGEGIVDACAPIVTEAYCLWNLEFDGTFTEEKAEEARKNSRDFVSKEHVKTFFDDAYSESLRESAYGFDTVREIGNEVGIVISAVGVSAVTHGAIPPSVLYGMSKAGNYVEENFQDENNGYLESILKGYGHGALDGIFFEIGMKGDKIAKSAATAVTKNALKEGGSAVLKKVGILGTKMLFEAGTAVAQDCSSILLNVGFSDDIITDESGRTIKFNNFSDKWNYYFEQYGGTKALYTSMGTAFFLSALSDSGDVFGKGTTQAAKRELNGLDEILAKNADVNTTVKNADLDINASKISKNASDINKINNSNEFKIIQDITGGAAADERVLKQVDGISKKRKKLEKIKLKDSTIPEKVFADYNGNLKKYIFDNMPQNLSGVEKARYIYCKLNNEVSYSKLWNSKSKVSGIDVDGIYTQNINIENFTGQEIICSNWANMYHELLDEAGVENYIRGFGDRGHKWVVFTENGKYYMADATNNFERAHDLARMQGHVQSGGFLEITKEQFDSERFANDLADKKNNGQFLYQKALTDSTLNINKIDKKLGFNYEDAEKLFGEGLHQGNSPKELKHLGLTKNSTIEEVATAKLEKNLFNKINNMGVLEAWGYTKITQNRIFTGLEQLKIQSYLVADAISGEESIMYRVIGGKSYLYKGKGILEEINEDIVINNQDYGYIRIV